MDAELLREELGGFLQDLPPDGHAVVIADDADPGALQRAARDAAADAGELLAVHGAQWEGAEAAPPFDPLTWGPILQELVASARSQGFRGALVIVLAAAPVAALGAQGHLAAERALGLEAPSGARVVCFYGTRTAAEVGLDALAQSHAGMLLPAGGAP